MFISELTTTRRIKNIKEDLGFNNYYFNLSFYSDTGDAAFNNKDKAILYMRWIRKHLQSIEQALAEAS